MVVEIKYAPRQVIKYLTIASLSLIGLSICAVLSQNGLWINFFYLGTDFSLPTWFASLTLLLCSALLAVIAQTKRSECAPYFRHWILLSILFAFMSIDEVARIHETIGEQLHYLPIRDRIVEYLAFSPSVRPFFSYSWVLLGIPLVIALILIYLPFLKILPSKTRFLFIASGIIYVSGALGLEMLASRNATIYGQGSRPDIWTTTAEESLEMFGVLLFIYALQRYLVLHTSGFEMRIVGSSIDLKTVPED